jgi:LysM repeat protein
MKTYRALIMVLVLLMVIGLVACNRSLAPSKKQPGQTQTAAPTSPTDVMNQIYLFATQTAMVAQGTPLAPGATGAVTTPQVPAETGQPAVPPAGAATATQQPVAPPPTAAPTRAVIVVPTATPGIPTNYVLQTKEFPYCIARRFNVDPGELLRLNGLSSYSVYYAGMNLRIPQSGRPFPGNRSLMPHPDTYIVRAGDTIYSIACMYGDADPNAIALANGLTPPYRMTPGQSLYIP